MSNARRARRQARLEARRAARVAPYAMQADNIPFRRALAGHLLRVLVLAFLCGTGVMLAWSAWLMSPYNPASLPTLRSAVLAHAVVSSVYAWNVEGRSRFVPLMVAALAGASLLAYMWRVAI